ncbi:MAG: Integral membrane protein MviN [Candidatus Woesebacteria bacterium GW2011_GWA1_45_8]|uniref:Probable lipid II flippase MurJ n=1 Tax=Candidatus Woesebacteria bacterium GW2011_GWA1_45_8 TaxID=1618559 RepID=A0A0G1Q3J6_9BACT|nr:MAG: Integral membrane protein MviN [Candidatus Woesebacteria bacterium GW2011_GWA1_45_8]
MQDIFNKSKKIFLTPQSSVLSAATIIMIMVVASRVLGLVRQRALAHFFTPNELSLFFAAFRLPDLVFEVLVFGTFASAFIPVFTKALKRGNREAWEIAGTVTNIGVLVFLVFAAIVIIFANNLYGILAPGFSTEHREQIVTLTRLLFAAQGFFVVSYVLTAVLESSRRFLVPALAPLLYNLGIIAGTLLLAPKLGLLAPAVGVVIGAASHFLIQLPLAVKLGFRFIPRIRLTDEVKKIGKLALPRIIEVSFLQATKTVELFLASLISTASYTYFTFGVTLQLLPVGLFGTSIAKAALPTLSRQADTPPLFRRTLFGALYQVSFLVLPIATALIVLRIPIVRLIFGTDIFSWEATVQTGMVVSAFALGVFFQAASSLLARGFYALHDTRTPVAVSLGAIALNISADFILIKGLGVGVWGLAAAFSFGAFIQAILLFFLLNKKIGDGIKLSTVIPIIKAAVSSFGAGAVMYFLLKVFDRSVWIKQLSFLGKIEGVRNIVFEKFVLDTRYTANLLILTVFVLVVGAVVYLALSFMFKSRELAYFFGLIRKIVVGRRLQPIPAKEQEQVTPPPTDSSSP